jgi:hypothetical protein
VRGLMAACYHGMFVTSVRCVIRSCQKMSESGLVLSIKKWLDRHDSVLQGLREALIRDLIAIVVSYALAVRHCLPSSFLGQTYSTPDLQFSPSAYTYRHVFSRFTLAACPQWCVRFHAGCIPAFSTGFANDAEDIHQQVVARSWSADHARKAGPDDSLYFSKSRCSIEIPIVDDPQGSGVLVTRGSIRAHSDDAAWNEEASIQLCDENYSAIRLYTREGKLECDLYVAVHADTERGTLHWAWFDLVNPISSATQLDTTPSPPDGMDHQIRVRMLESRRIRWSNRFGAALSSALDPNMRPFIDLGYGSSASFQNIPHSVLSHLDPIFQNSE